MFNDNNPGKVIWGYFIIADSTVTLIHFLLEVEYNAGYHLCASSRFRIYRYYIGVVM